MCAVCANMSIWPARRSSNGSVAPPGLHRMRAVFRSPPPLTTKSARWNLPRGLHETSTTRRTRGSRRSALATDGCKPTRGGSRTTTKSSPIYFARISGIASSARPCQTSKSKPCCAALKRASSHAAPDSSTPTTCAVTNRSAGLDRRRLPRGRRRAGTGPRGPAPAPGNRRRSTRPVQRRLLILRCASVAYGRCFPSGRRPTRSAHIC
mmetsp:Transcript_14401/g.44551  ORF Transcript_14401/g.44551 Transcript_14401/m.44551 type:complete len:208 (-) Transcript_14401:125-748(-)